MIRTGALRVDSELAERARSVLNSAAGFDGTVAFLRQEGEDKIGTIRMLACISSLDLGEIKRRVHLSQTWQDRLADDDHLHASLLQAVNDLGLQTEPVEPGHTPALLAR